MAEIFVGFADHVLEIGSGHFVADKRLHHREGDGMVRLALEARDRRRGKLRPGLRHIESAVARETCEQHVGKRGRRRLATGRNVAQRGFSWFARKLGGAWL